MHRLARNARREAWYAKDSYNIWGGKVHNGPSLSRARPFNEEWLPSTERHVVALTQSSHATSLPITRSPWSQFIIHLWSKFVTPLWPQLKAVFAAWINILLLFVPAGFAVSYTHQSPTTVFVTNLFAIIPVSFLLMFTSDELGLHIGDTLGALLSMSFSNATQLISSIFLLKSRQIFVLRSSLLGGILQNLLVMTGFAFLLGGFKRVEQFYNPLAAQTMGMFLLLAVFSLTVPTVSQLWGHSTDENVAAMSRGTAVVIMFSYGLWLFFQLRTHRDLFEEMPTKKRRETLKTSKNPSPAAITRENDIKQAIVRAPSSAAHLDDNDNNNDITADDNDDNDDKKPVLGPIFALSMTITFTAILAFNAQFASDSIQGLMEEHSLSTAFMGIVVFPLLSIDPTPIFSGVNDEMDQSLSLTLHKSIQTALMVVPVIIFIAWGMGIDDMTLDFDAFSLSVLFCSILIVTYVVLDGKSNWLIGALLIKVFIIIGVASFYIH